MAETAAFKYRAFISYSHANTSWAKWLHRGLESFRIDKDLVGRETATGTIPKSLRPIFRDRDDFAAGHTLTDQTLAALDASAALIVLCSPASAKSNYVNEEIRLFKTHHPDRRVIPLVVGGTPGDPQRECFPAALKFELDDEGNATDKPIELLAADAREEGDGRHLALAKVVAGLLGVSSNDIYRRAERERRHRQRRWIAGVSAVVLVLAGIAVWAEINRREAVAQRAVAEEQKKVAEENYEWAMGATRQVSEKLIAMGDLMLEKGASDAALAAYQESLAIARHMAIAEPTIVEDGPLVMANLISLGDLMLRSGDNIRAFMAYEESLHWVHKLSNADPSNVDLQRQLHIAYDKVGNVLVADDQLGEIVKASPNWRRELAATYRKAATALARQDDTARALEVFKKAQAVIARLEKESPEDTQLRHDRASLDAEIAKLEQAQTVGAETEQPE